MRGMICSLLFLMGCGSSSHPSSYVFKRAGVSAFEELSKVYDLNMIRHVTDKNRVVSKVSTDYFYNEEVDVMTARYLLHAAVDEYMKRISEDIEVKPFLKDGLLNSEDIECMIFFKKGLRDKSAISSVSLLDGMVRYNCFDSEDGVNKKILEEKYK